MPRSTELMGYWAESRIFGGVVLFDRREPHQREAHEDLLDTQKKSLLDFLESEDHVNEQTASSHVNPLPILPDKTNLTRVDPEEPLEKTGIYRDVWERKPLGDSDTDRRLGCVAYDEMDYPTFADYERREEEVKAEIEAEALAEQQEDEDEREVARVLKADK